MSKSFETIADTLIGQGTDPETIYNKLAEHMDKNGVPMMSLKRYGDQPAIVRLFGERGVTTTTPDRTAVIAPLLRAAYKPGQMSALGYLPPDKATNMLADALVRVDELTVQLAGARQKVAMEIGVRIDGALNGTLGMPIHRAYEKATYDIGAIIGEYAANGPR